MGMSSPEWSRYMHEELGLAESPQEINDEVVAPDARALRERAAADRRRGGGRAPARRRVHRSAVASSSNRPLIEAVLERGRDRRPLRRVVSSEEVERGKPAPDVYLEAARGSARARALRRDRGLLERDPRGARGRMRVLALPNAHYPPPPDALELADVVLASPDELTPGRVHG